MIRTDVLIIGGGLTGLSTAHHLNKRSSLRSLVVESAAKVGGTATSERLDGFVFDRTGHLLHLHSAYGRRLVSALLRGNLAERRRNAWIFSHKVFTRYPFQANTFGLPRKVVAECVEGFLRTVHRPKPPATACFKDWCLSAFGEGISRRFMLPYNEKLWRVPLTRLATDWQGPFVPKPDAAEVILGSLTDQKKGFGYNIRFQYPVQGGIQSLPDALARRLRSGQVRTDARVLSVDLRERVAVVEGLGEVGFRRLVNTIPLPGFLDLAGPLPRAVRDARRRLRHNRVLCLNIGVARADVSDKHWVYFPEKSFAFYRAGFASNFSRRVAPRGTTSMYIEAARAPGERTDFPALERQFLGGLRRCGILKASDKIVTRQWVPIEYGYVVYDLARRRALDVIFAGLRKRRVESIGRYGGWKYSFMEAALLEGKSCAESLAGALGARLGKGPGHAGGRGRVKR